MSRNPGRLTVRASANATLVLNTELTECQRALARNSALPPTKDTLEQRKHLREFERDIASAIEALECMARKHAKKRASSRKRLRDERKEDRQLVLPNVPFHGIKIVEVERL